FVQARSGSTAFAGAAAAAYVVGLAAFAPVLGRLMDGLGPRPVLAATAVVYPAALALLIVLVLRPAGAWAVLAAAATAGAAFPPLTVCMRTLYPTLLRGPALLQTAYSVASALVELIFIVGPALVAAFVALGLPVAAVGFAAVCAAAGTAAFLRAPGLARWRRHAGVRRNLFGPLRSRRLLAVFAATVLYAVAFGLYEMAVIAHAAYHGRPAAAGVILALASCGSAIGVLTYGGREWRAAVPRQFLVAVGALVAALLMLAPIRNLYAFALANVIAGLPMAAVLTVQSLLVSRLAPRETLAESFTWGVTCLLAGISAGMALGGALAEHYDA